jgi:guanylate kinase
VEPTQVVVAERADVPLAQLPLMPEHLDDRTGLPPHILNPVPLLIVLSGPSGVGKDSVLKRMKELGYPFHFVVTATTRPQRPGEVHGQDYLFITEDQYRQWLAQGEFLEHARVYDYNYGVPKQQVRDAWARGQDVILRIDVQGAATIRRIVPQALFIFLAAASLDELMRRLVERKTETGAGLTHRMATARAEMQRLNDFDYVVINSDECLDQAVNQILAIIQAEKCRVQPRRIAL